MSKAFTTTLEAVSSNKSKTTIKLSMSNSAARQFSSMFLNSIDKELVVSFDDPQMSMNLEPNGRQGITATIDGGGVVDRVEREGQDEGLAEEEELDFGSDGGDGGGEAPEQDADSEDGGDSEGSTDESGEAAGDDQEEETENDSAEVSKGELEEFIIDVRPAFTDIPYDFPGILEQKRDTGCSWIDISRKINVTTSKLQAAYTVYKKRVKKLIAEQQESNGAA